MSKYPIVLICVTMTFHTGMCCSADPVMMKEMVRNRVAITADASQCLSPCGAMLAGTQRQFTVQLFSSFSGGWWPERKAVDGNMAL